LVAFFIIYPLRILRFCTAAGAQQRKLHIPHFARFALLRPSSSANRAKKAISFRVPTGPEKKLRIFAKIRSAEKKL